MAWRQGEHVLLVGKTGGGKTFAAKILMSLRQYVAMLIIKADDEVWWGWREVERAEQVKLTERGPKKWRVFPKATTLRLTRGMQRFEFSEMLERIWQEEGWTIEIGELYYCQVRLNLGDELVTLWTTGRSKHITCVGECQRPARIDRHFISESRFLICFRVGDGRDRDTLGEIVGDKAWGQSLRDLKRYQFSIYDKDTGSHRLGTAATLKSLLTSEWY